MKLNEYIIGQEFVTKSFQITKEKIQEFAKEYDPQYMHLDEEKAEQGRFQGLIASGMHTLAISFKQWVEKGKYGEDIIAGTAMDNVKFIRPVYPEDTLYTIVKVIDKRERQNGTGILTVRLTTYNHKEEKVFKGDLSALVKSEA